MCVYTFQTQIVPWKLWATLGCLLSVDLILLSVWSIVDPLQREVKDFPKVKPDNDLENDIEIQPQLEHCKSEHHYVWLGELFQPW